jgi:hypothetical protein
MNLALPTPGSAQVLEGLPTQAVSAVPESLPGCCRE